MNEATMIDLMHATIRRVPLRVAAWLCHNDTNEDRWQRAVAFGVRNMKSSA